MAIALVVITLDIRTAKLSEIYDEGVYWQSLRAMSAGSPPLSTDILFTATPFLAVDLPILRIVGFYDYIRSRMASRPFLSSAYSVRT